MKTHNGHLNTTQNSESSVDRIKIRGFHFTAAKKGGEIAKQASQALEAKTGKSVVTVENFLPPGKVPRPKKIK